MKHVPLTEKSEDNGLLCSIFYQETIVNETMNEHVFKITLCICKALKLIFISTTKADNKYSCLEITCSILGRQKIKQGQYKGVRLDSSNSGYEPYSLEDFVKLTTSSLKFFIDEVRNNTYATGLCDD